MKMRTIVIVMAFISVCFSHHGWSMSKPPATGYTQTKYPIVLTHGLFGFDDILGIDYWYKVPETLRQDGADVYVTVVANANTPEIRGEQLIPQVEQILAITGAEKVNLIGHSLGGPTVRYVASVRPDLVASVTTVAGVNRGVPSSLPDDLSPASEQLLNTFGNILPNLIDGITGVDFEQDYLAALRSMTPEQSAVFNELHGDGIPDTECGEGAYEVNGIRYYSWSGAQPTTNVLDPSDILTALGANNFPEGVANDGAVGSCSSRLGMVIRDDFSMNHLDEVNHLFGIHDLAETDPLTVFRTHANRLKEAGL